MTSYLDTPPRTIWQAVRDLFTKAHAELDEALWDRAYRLWVQACISNAPGEPFMLTHFRPLWLPTTVPPEPAVVAAAMTRAGCALGNGELDAGHTLHQNRRGWQPR